MPSIIINIALALALVAIPFVVRWVCGNTRDPEAR